jgi:hypothetical protein
VVTLPGEAFLLPVELPERIAELTVEALAQSADAERWAETRDTTSGRPKKDDS